MLLVLMTQVRIQIFSILMNTRDEKFHRQK